MTIQIMSEQLASQIAAGEVVERPSSVVKELIENSLDAGATTINLDIREGGRDLIQIADDGSGMPTEEVALAFRRHATSKLQQISDLNAIDTLGFRGEALAAIAAVSRLTVVTRAQGEESGTRVVMEGGKIVSRDNVGAPQGTVLAVESLFFNTPARLKFLKTVATEKKLIDEFVTRYAMAYPQVRFRLAHNGRVTFQTTGNGDLRDVLLQVYGTEIARQLLPIDEAEEVLDEASPLTVSEPKPSFNPNKPQVRGYVAPPSLHWSNRNRIDLFVNGRWIKDASLTYAIIQAYHTLLPTGRYPLAVVFVSVPPTEIDVNVHPAKTEIRFRGRTPFGSIQRAIRRTIIADTPVRQMSSNWSWGDHATRQKWERPKHDMPSWDDEPNPQGSLDLAWEDTSGLSAVEIGQNPEPTPAPSANLAGERLPIMRVVGQVGSSYIITEGPEGIYMIDQHAAHERILYEQFLADYEREGQVVSQGLMAGTAVHLSPPHYAQLEEHWQSLHKVGFQIEAFGPQTVMVRAIPTILIKQDPSRALHNVLEELERGDTPLQESIEDKIIRRVCKTASVKAGQTLTNREMEAMIKQLEACHNPHTCPHGRPTLIYLSVAQLATQFGRT